jgi:hypothetical protein
MILKGFGFVVFFVGVKVSSFRIHLSCLVCCLFAVRELQMHYINKFIIPSQLYVFRETFSPIITGTWLYLQYLAVFTQVAAGWCRK